MCIRDSHRCVARSDDADTRADRDRILLANASEKSQRVDDAFAVFAVDTKVLRELSADGHEDTVESFAAQVLEGEVLACRLAVADLDAEFLEDRHVLVDLRFRQAVRRDRTTCLL